VNRKGFTSYGGNSAINLSTKSDQAHLNDLHVREVEPSDLAPLRAA
jgi:hypothetical protein